MPLVETFARRIVAKYSEPSAEQLRALTVQQALERYGDAVEPDRQPMDFEAIGPTRPRAVA